VPAMQNAGLAALGLNWRYVAFEVHPDDLGAAIRGAQEMNFIGLNLTVPHELPAVDMVDVVEDSARGWGAVNTIVFEAQDEQGGWRRLAESADIPRQRRSHGVKTDADAIAWALREDLGLQLTGAKVLLLGAGGAGRTAVLEMWTSQAAPLEIMRRAPEQNVYG